MKTYIKPEMEIVEFTVVEAVMGNDVIGSSVETEQD